MIEIITPVRNVVNDVKNKL